MNKYKHIYIAYVMSFGINLLFVGYFFLCYFLISLYLSYDSQVSINEKNGFEKSPVCRKRDLGFAQEHTLEKEKRHFAFSKYLIFFLNGIFGKD